MRPLLDAILSVVFASPCAACERPLDTPTDGPVCHRCWAAVHPFTPPLCDTCGDPLAAWQAVSLPSLSSPPLARCPRCRRSPRSVSRARAAGSYEGPLRAVVHALKYEGRRSLARPLARLMRDRSDGLLAGIDVAVPVLLHRSRRRERGFDQAADLARYLEVPVRPVLRRVRATATQATLPAARRHANVRGAFAVARRVGDLGGLIVVLVDDVSTTGATLEACARVLTSEGVKEVRALTAARVVTSRAAGTRP